MRRTSLVALALLWALPFSAGAAQALPFSIVLLPDTQHYTEDDVRIQIFEAQTQWIVDNQAADNITFVTQVGDIVEHGGGAPITYLTLASDFIEEETFHQASVDPSLLVAGDNVIAVEIHQSQPDSSDISFDLDLTSFGAGTLIPTGASWLYLDDGSDQGSAWTQPGFADGGWSSGPAELGYGDGDEATLVRCSSDPVCNTADPNKFITTYFRHHFNVADPATLGAVTLDLKRDDGAVVYLNGVEIYRSNMPGNADGNQAEWDRAMGALDTLDGDLLADPDGLLPYGATCGNHDFDEVDSKISAAQYIANAGPTRYLGRSWYVGAAPDQINQAQTFEANGNTYLNLGLEWHPSDAAIEWAQSVIAAHPHTPTIISTHEHLMTGQFAFRSQSGATPDSSGDNDGDSLFEKLVEPFPQVFMVLSGHIHGNGWNEATTLFGQSVEEILADYQEDPNGGNGFMQVMHFRPESNELELQTVSPTYEPGVTSGPDRSVDPESNYTLTMDLDEHLAYLGSTAVVHFRQGQDHGFGTYTGAVDTLIGDGSDGFILPDVAYGSDPDLHADGDGDHEQALLRFGGIVGYAPGQIPPGTPLDAATVTITTEGFAADSTSGGTFHRMNLAWDGNTTWNDLAGGVQVGTEAELAADADAAGLVDLKGTDSFPVTAGVQAWVDGAPNHGWVIVNDGDDGWRFRSAEWEGVVERPMLSAAFPAGCSDGIDDDGDGFIDYPDDPGCTGPQDGWETETGFPCDDGIDNDGDGDRDFPADASCISSLYPSEGAACDDGLDNDGDGLIDFDGGGVGPGDPGCLAPYDDSETNGSTHGCGVGAELMLLLPLLGWLRRRQLRA
jgi:hypothetical protein